jgi:hypothetical protein
MNATDTWYTIAGALLDFNRESCTSIYAQQPDKTLFDSVLMMYNHHQQRKCRAENSNPWNSLTSQPSGRGVAACSRSSLNILPSAVDHLQISAIGRYVRVPYGYTHDLHNSYTPWERSRDMYSMGHNIARKSRGGEHVTRPQSIMPTVPCTPLPTANRHKEGCHVILFTLRNALYLPGWAMGCQSLSTLHSWYSYTVSCISLAASFGVSSESIRITCTCDVRVRWIDS